MVPFTVITSANPLLLCKVLTLGPDLQLQSRPAASMVEGHAERRTTTGLRELCGYLEPLAPNQAVAWGLTTAPAARIVMDKALLANRGAIARTREHFTWAAGPAVMMLDHDGTAQGADPYLTAEAFRAALVSACPALADAPMLIRPSSSSGIYTADGRVLAPLRKWRAYLLVSDGTEIPAAGKRLETLLWADGLGWADVSKAGTVLYRTIIDGGVWSPERLDFAAAPQLQDCLQRPYVAPLIVNEAAPPFDLTRIGTTEDHEGGAHLYKAIARASVEARAAAVREAYANERAPSIAARTGRSEDAVRAALIDGATRQVLPGDFPLEFADGRAVTVADVLADKPAFNCKLLADPLEPDYGDDQRIAVLYTTDRREPVIFSHAHGGQQYVFEPAALAAAVFGKMPLPLPPGASPVPLALPTPPLPPPFSLTPTAATLDGLMRWAVTDEKVKDMQATRLIWRDLLAETHLITWMAPGNGGKTSLALFAAGELARDGFKVFFFQEDAASGDLPALQDHARNHGYTLLSSTLAGTGTDEQVTYLRALGMAQDADGLRGAVFIFDTLKKYLDLMSKGGARDFFKMLRALTMRGATVLLLGHTNKHLGADGKRVFEGVGDVRNDVDELAYLESTERDPLGRVTITLRHDKTRSRVEVEASFLLDTSTREVTPLAAPVNVRALAEEKRQRDEDEPVIAVVRRALADGPVLFTSLRRTVAANSRIGEKAAAKVIERYLDKLWDEDRKRANNARPIKLRPLDQVTEASF
jgi:hypothetical protein